MSQAASSPAAASSGAPTSFLGFLGQIPGALNQAFAPQGGIQGVLGSLLQAGNPQAGAAGLGRAMIASQNNALNQALARQQLEQNQLAMQRMLMQLGYAPALLAQFTGQGGSTDSSSSAGPPAPSTSLDPSDAPASSSSGSATAGATAPGTPPPSANGAPAQPSATPQQQVMRALPRLLMQRALSSAAPPGAPGSASAPTAALGQQGAAPPGVMPAPGSAARPGYDPLQRLRAAEGLSAIGWPGADSLVRAASTALQYSPALATQMAAAKGQLAQDQLLVARARQSGNPLAFRAAQMKYLKDSGLVTQSSMNGAVQTFGGITPGMLGMSTYNPVQGVMTQNGTESPIPGAVNTEAALGAAKEGAEERARLSASTSPAGSIVPSGAPSAQPPAGASAALGAARGAPPVALAVPPDKQGNAALTSNGYVPPVLSAPAQQPQRPGNLGLAALQKFQEEQAEDAAEATKEMAEKADNAKLLITQAQQIEDAANNFTPGRYGAVKGEVMAAFQGLPVGDAVLRGIFGPNGVNALGSYQEGQKLAIQLQALATKQLGSREAAQIFSVLGKSIPNLTLSADGLQKISAYLQGVARYQLAQATFAQRLQAQDNVAGINNLPQAFQTYSNPAFYILASAPAKARTEMLASVPAPKRATLIAQWQQAAKMGLAPLPADYEAQ